MADVQWIRFVVGMFDGNSFKRIKRARIGGVPFRDKLTAVWFELLDLAGKSNAHGYLIDNNEIPYHSFEDIATMLDREEKEIELCMQFFISERMVEIIDDVYCLTNFMKYQNQDGLEKIREQNRLRKQKQREKLKLLSGVSRDMSRDVTEDVTQCHDIEEEEERDKEKEIHSFNHSIAQGDEFSTEFSTDESKMQYMQGKLGEGVIFMSDEQFHNLLEILSLDELHKYFEIVVSCEKQGKHFKKKTHYQAILDMAMKDRAVRKKGG